MLTLVQDISCNSPCDASVPTSSNETCQHCHDIEGCYQGNSVRSLVPGIAVAYSVSSLTRAHAQRGMKNVVLMVE